MQNRVIRTFFTVMVVIALVVVGSMAYIWFSGGTAQASAAITSPDLQVSETGKIFHITAEESEARFIINETLVGQPKTVVGATNEVAGQIMVDFEHPLNTKIGVIKINARTLTTDNEFRNRALRSQILMSSKPEYEFITFTPTKLIGLPEQITVGEEFSFQIAGKLTVRDVTRDVVFEAIVKPVSKTQLTGSAKTTVRYRDFSITIPQAPGVANISEEVGLEFTFAAQPE